MYLPLCDTGHTAGVAEAVPWLCHAAGTELCSASVSLCQVVPVSTTLPVLNQVSDRTNGCHWWLRHSQYQC